MFPPQPPNMFPYGGGYVFPPYTPNAFPPMGRVRIPPPLPQCVPPAAPSGKEEGKPPAPVPYMHAQGGQAAPRGAIFRPISPSDGK